MKKITLLAQNENYSQFYKKELKNIFEDFFEIDYRHIDMEPIPPVYNTDLILYTDPELLNQMISVVKCDSPKLMMKRTITREALKKIKKIPDGSRVLVANINQYMANETMALIYQLGVTDIHLYPYYEEKNEIPKNIEYIIIPEPEPYDFIPNIDAENILIGNRIFDISNVLDILSLLRIDNKKNEEIIKKYLPKVPTFWYGFKYSWENRRVILKEWNLLLDELDIGVIVTDSQNNVELVNNKAKHLLNLINNNIEDKSLDFLLDNGESNHKNKLLKNKEKKDELIQVGGRELVVTIKSVKVDKEFYGKIIIISQYEEIKEVQQKIHKKIVGKGHSSEYNFEDLIGKDTAFEHAKNVARKISKSNSTVLLLGDSGTGKEMFAGAIHNYSHRSNDPFVAINCATLPENLLESELFGYDEGAFTGAQKGGKIGLFEQADGGTIFLDEIGDLPLKLQARLLRAIEEKEIMRLGGNSVIKVDVRVIAATNHNLMQLVQEGDFRKDLFYRLNVFQIELPALTQRKEDISLLIDHFLENWCIERKICGDFENFYKTYSWPGNVRELKNVLEYMTTICDGMLSYINLPSYLKKRDYYVNSDYNGGYLLLKILYYRSKMDFPTGRRSLTETFNKLFYEISEIEVRNLIDDLEDQGYLEVNIGRAGNEITEKGILSLKEVRFLEDMNQKRFIS